MASKLRAVLSKASEKTTPSASKRRQVLALAERLKKRVEQAAHKAGIDIEVRLEGSVAKNTWLRESPDIDIFMRVPASTPRESFGTTYLDIAKEATKDAKQMERFAEHPYLEAIVNKTRVNIVPCYRVENGEWKSATDRTPFHTDYIKPLLDERLCREIRLLKRFMKGTNVYGAEIKVGGLSGYLCELLVLFYGSFQKVLKASADWNPRTFIDPEGCFEGREKELRLIFEEPLVIVDPVDKGRNAASAVRSERLEEFIAASRAFLNKPDLKYFYPSETKPFTLQTLLRAMKIRGTSLIFTQLGEIGTVPDVLWGQLYRSQRSLVKLLEAYGFKVVQDAVWSDEKTLNLFLMEVEQRFLPPIKKHLGPPLEKKAECEKFLKKHVVSASTLSGPRLEEGRWIVGVERKHTDAAALLRDKLKDGGRNAGVAELVSKTLTRGFRVIVNEEILPTYTRSREFRKFLTEYMKGKPKWLA